MAVTKDKILGSDAVMTASGFVDTTNGCVVTAPQALFLVRRKESGNARKRRAKDIKKIESELARIIKKSQPATNRSRKAQRHRTVLRSGHQVRTQSRVERRLVANLHTLKALPF